MSVSEIRDWVTLIAAVLAATISIYKAYSDSTAKTDRVGVSFGPDARDAPCTPGYWLHVVSRRDHAMTLRDYGFIDRSGKLMSLPSLWSEPELNDPDDPTIFSGVSTLTARNAEYVVGQVRLSYTQIGSYAITNSQSRYTIAFADSVPLHRKLALRAKIWWKPVFQ